MRPVGKGKEGRATGDMSGRTGGGGGGGGAGREAVEAAAAAAVGAACGSASAGADADAAARLLFAAAAESFALSNRGACEEHTLT